MFLVIFPSSIVSRHVVLYIRLGYLTSQSTLDMLSPSSSLLAWHFCGADSRTINSGLPRQTQLRVATMMLVTVKHLLWVPLRTLPTMLLRLWTEGLRRALERGGDPRQILLSQPMILPCPLNGACLP